MCQLYHCQHAHFPPVHDSARSAKTGYDFLASSFLFFVCQRPISRSPSLLATRDHHSASGYLVTLFWFTFRRNFLFGWHFWPWPGWRSFWTILSATPILIGYRLGCHGASHFATLAKTRRSFGSRCHRREYGEKGDAKKQGFHGCCTKGRSCIALKEKKVKMCMRARDDEKRQFSRTTCFTHHLKEEKDKYEPILSRRP